MAKKAHFIGICGAGMAGVAVMMKSLGYSVTGSDEGFYDPVFSYLKRHDIQILSPHRGANIPKDAEIIVIGRHAKLNPDENEEVREALKYKEKIKSFPEILGDITADKENIVVAGSYGKSTVSALLAWCLIEMGTKPGYFIGAMAKNFEVNGAVGESKYFVLEGDEYPAYNGPSKFLYYKPTHIVLTSLEHDHVNVFPTIDSYIEPYEKLLALLPGNGTLVTAINNPNVKKVLEKYNGELITYGMEKNKSDFYPDNILYGQETTFDLYKNDEKIATLRTTLLGNHNIENIVGVAAFLIGKNLISPSVLEKAVQGFKGLARRIELKTEKSSLLIYEGFGSSYTKARTVFEALRLHFPNKRIVTIFEPHTFSWRNKNNLGWYSDIFKDSNETLIYKPPEHGGATHDQATLEEIISRVKTEGNLYAIKTKEQALEILEKIARPDDLIVLMSSGDLGGLIREVPLWAERKFPK
jgi:UDP-N-acetylmuramate: L-alanyl-gamma-D-glutamyl-meso-diaminopimelate ligase